MDGWMDEEQLQRWQVAFDCHCLITALPLDLYVRCNTSVMVAVVPVVSEFSEFSWGQQVLSLWLVDTPNFSLNLCLSQCGQASSFPAISMGIINWFLSYISDKPWLKITFYHSQSVCLSRLISHLSINVVKSISFCLSLLLSLDSCQLSFNKLLTQTGSRSNVTVIYPRFSGLSVRS